MKYLILNALDLSDNEKAILDVLEKQKMGQNVTTIAEKAKIPRTSAIYILKKFEKWKIAKKVRLGGQWRWMINKLLH